MKLNRCRFNIFRIGSIAHLVSSISIWLGWVRERTQFSSVRLEMSIQFGSARFEFMERFGLIHFKSRSRFDSVRDNFVLASPSLRLAGPGQALELWRCMVLAPCTSQLKLGQAGPGSGGAWS